MKWKKSIRSAPALALLLSTVILLVWLICMVGITLATAFDYMDYFDEVGRTLAGRVVRTAELEQQDTDADPARRDYRIWEALWSANHGAPVLRSSGGEILYATDQSIDYQAAVAVYDGQGNLLQRSGNFFYFPYDTEDAWNAKTEDSANNTSGYAKADINMNRLLEQSAHLQDDHFFWDSFLTFDVSTMRFTGQLEGSELTVHRIEYVSKEEFRRALYSREPDEYSVDAEGNESVTYHYSESEVIRTENVPWHTLYEFGEVAAQDVTLYTTRAELCTYDYMDEDASLLLLSLQALESTENIYQNSERSLREMTVYWRNQVFDHDTVIPPDEHGNERPLMYSVTTAMRFFPLSAAMESQAYLYRMTLIPAVLLALIVFWLLHRKLLGPLRRLDKEISSHSERILLAPEFPAPWAEPLHVAEHYNKLLEQDWMKQTEITRLNTALEYAKDAEQNRRQMTSNVAHELKTPLAVIHSYAEGLKEHIAEDKRDKYIDVILAESEHLDDMVLELLDLSRLEAGKVKLALDSVSLIDLTHNVFERLDMAAQAKELNITFDLPEACTIQADEARIKQVIENFASNAVKYTPVGGNIRVTVSRQEFRTRPAATTFAIENDSPPLSDEALSKVWETFYRTDDSRSGGGTGLGLAIAKNIVELHGGTCGVRNTETGVEFKFTI